MPVYKEIRVTKSGDMYDYYIADLGTINGKRVKRGFRTRAEAQAHERNFKRQVEKLGSLSTTITASQGAIAMNAFQLLEANGIAEAELINIVKAHIKRSAAIVKSVQLGEALDEYLSSFDQRKQTLHCRTVRNRVCNPLTEQFDYKIPLVEITEEDIDAMFRKVGKDYGDVSYNNTLSYQKSFFNWCIEKRYIESNPLAKLKTKRIAYEDPSFIKAKDLEKVLNELDTNGEIKEEDRTYLINFISLSFFAGLRSSEIYRLPISAVHPNDATPFVRVSTTKGAARGVKGRVVDLEPNAVAWLKKYPLREQIGERRLCRIRRRIRGLCGKTLEPIFVKNVARHSYITYHTAKYRDCARTEAFVGTSASMRVRHYQGLATTQEAERYFNIFPSL